MLSTGFATTATEFSRQIIPGDAGFEYEENAGEDHAIVERFASRIAFPPWRMRRQQRLNAFPQGIGYERFHGKHSRGWRDRSQAVEPILLTMNYQLIACQRVHF